MDSATRVHGNITVRETTFPNGSVSKSCKKGPSEENTSTLISASRKRRRKGNPLVSDETVMYGYEASVTLTTDRLHYKLQTRPLVREQSNCPAKEKKKKNLVDTKKDRPTDRRPHQLNSTQLNSR
jgi:hypothetical protein